MSVGTLLGTVSECGSKIAVEGVEDLIPIAADSKGVAGETTAFILTTNESTCEAKPLSTPSLDFGELTCVAIRKRLIDIPLDAQQASTTIPYILYLVRVNDLTGTEPLFGYEVKTIKSPISITFINLTTTEASLDRNAIIQQGVLYEGSPGTVFKISDSQPQSLPIVVSAYLVPDTSVPMIYFGRISDDGQQLTPCGCLSVNKIKSGVSVLDAIPDDSSNSCCHSPLKVNMFCNRVIVRESADGWAVLMSNTQFLQLCATFTLNNTVTKFDTAAASPSASYVLYQASTPKRAVESNGPGGQRQRAPPKSPPAPPKSQLKRRKQ
eukprot:TRINITY_DN36798_c0_g1_i1.p1 TRINITY_DN36798_c0_g1~~TRINITY_DN36798_c0_g1_i1.p1  ORF type:complete len:323 (+),score=56.44 TRINITY_DN36798_c0_g1_i1:90-1058(+)